MIGAVLRSVAKVWLSGNALLGTWKAWLWGRARRLWGWSTPVLGQARQWRLPIWVSQGFYWIALIFVFILVPIMAAAIVIGSANWPDQTNSIHESITSLTPWTVLEIDGIPWAFKLHDYYKPRAFPWTVAALTTLAVSWLAVVIWTIKMSGKAQAAPRRKRFGWFLALFLAPLVLYSIITWNTVFDALRYSDAWIGAFLGAAGWLVAAWTWPRRHTAVWRLEAWRVVGEIRALLEPISGYLALFQQWSTARGDGAFPPPVDPQELTFLPALQITDLEIAQALDGSKVTARELSATRATQWAIGLRSQADALARDVLEQAKELELLLDGRRKDLKSSISMYQKTYGLQRSDQALPGNKGTDASGEKADAELS